MNINDFQQLSERTLIDKPDFELSGSQIMMLWVIIGLNGEIGELTEYIKKGILFQHGINKEKIKEELGDILWYVSSLATQFDLTLEEIIINNVIKLQKRYPNGYNSKDSKKRMDKK